MEDPCVNCENGLGTATSQQQNYVPTQICDVDERPLYGELILLGYNGAAEGQRSSGQLNRKHRSKMTLCRKDLFNGIKKFAISSTTAPPRQSQAVQDPSKHVVSYTYDKSHTVIVEYIPDESKDMFQIGRSSEDQIDFTIVDTWLAAGSNMVMSPAGNNMRLLRSSNCFDKNEVHPRPISSTISRYACRILTDREEPTKAYVYAAGFDNSKNIFLGEKATKWIKKNGEADGLTTNGILILHPNRNDVDEEASSSLSGDRKMYVWREVSVDGDIFTLRETRSSTKRGEMIPHETNQLQDGTLIDLCGATLLWRSADGWPTLLANRNWSISWMNSTLESLNVL
ncbi:hypothetical protein L596_030702 [Steinernema carpocapsae]|uniref:Pellino FHA domain-containing protein n=1 Tax=Steinernema carpocapsae TaxID=34508 RepID=A0A4V5ZX34_STECR|nr:hypothetical protein L596_030702 [Steinernema carpocapsae]